MLGNGVLEIAGFILKVQKKRPSLSIHKGQSSSCLACFLFIQNMGPSSSTLAEIYIRAWLFFFFFKSSLSQGDYFLIFGLAKQDSGMYSLDLPEWFHWLLSKPQQKANALSPLVLTACSLKAAAGWLQDIICCKWIKRFKIKVTIKYNWYSCYFQN